MTSPLDGLKVINLSINLPGPLAGARLAAMGAEVLKIEPPTGDPLNHASPAWYAEVTRAQQVLTLDLKGEEGLRRLHAELAEAELLITAFRPRALEGLGLGWGALHARHPRLSQVALTGFPPPEHDHPGHDLTYQAKAGLIVPPSMPRALVADTLSAEAAVSEALALLLSARVTGVGRIAYVAMSDQAARLREGLDFGLTAPGGLLGGGAPTYKIYPASEGWVALAALEPRFTRALMRALELGEDLEGLAEALSRRTARAWEAWGAEHDIPIVAVEEV